MSVQSVNAFVSHAVFLLLVAGIPLWGMIKKVPVYETFVEGAQDGFKVAIRIIPYLVAMLVAIGMLRAAGVFASLGHVLTPVLHWLGMPSDVLPLALVRPFSGSASNGVLANIIQTHGGDSWISKLAATMVGSTETTFYVVAVYFGAVKVSRTRHAIPAGLIADIVGILVAVWVCRLVFL